MIRLRALPEKRALVSTNSASSWIVASLIGNASGRPLRVGKLRIRSVFATTRMKLRRHSPQAQISLDETHGDHNLLLAELLPDHQPNPEEVCCKRELSERLADATTQLSPTLRKTFQLRGLDGLSIRETAHLLGVPSGTVKAQLARGRARLKQIVKKSLQGKCDSIRRISAKSST